MNLSSPKKQLAIWLTLTPIITMAQSSGVCQQQYGITHCGPGVVDNVRAAGTATLDGTTVTKSAKISGDAHIQQAKINNLKMAGQLNLNHSTIQEASISGYLASHDSEFTQKLTLAAQDALFDNTKVAAIDVHCQRKTPTVIELKNHSRVHGDITFDHCQGEVIVDSDSKVNGKVINGKISSSHPPSEPT